MIIAMEQKYEIATNVAFPPWRRGLGGLVQNIDTLNT